MDQENSTLANKRLEWVDIFKGIMITLVVIGHATGFYNSWIYQFHMAAFFFISGYLSNIEKQNCLVLATKKILTIFLPFIVMSLFGIGVNWFIDRFGYYEFLFGASFIGIKNSITELLFHGNLYVQYLGTFWFLSTLLGIELLQILMYLLAGKRLNMYYFGLSTMLFFLGYFFVHYSYVAKIVFFDLDLIFIGQGYFNMGLFLRKRRIEEILQDGKKFGRLIIVCIAIIISIWGGMNGITVDYPARRFEYPFSEFIVAMASIYVVYYISRYLENRLYFVKKTVAVLGRNSLGIMSLHFVFFKLYMLFLYFKHIASADQISSVVLPAELQTYKYWISMTFFSILGSLIVWKCVSLTPVIRFLLGQDQTRNKDICRYIDKCTLSSYLRLSYNNSIGCFWNRADRFVKNNRILVGALGGLVILFSIPMSRTGIIINDELQARCLSMQGFCTFYKTEFFAWIGQGRLLAAPINSFTKWLSFIGVNCGTAFRIGSIIILLGVVLAFGILNYSLFKDRGLAIFTAVFSMICMPIAFEHTSPNAFVGFIAFSFLLVNISLISYVHYIEKRRKIFANISMILFFISMMSYEAFITFLPLYLFVVIGKTGYKYWKKNIKLYIIPIATSVIFLVVYYISGRLVPSGYEGNQLGFSNIFAPLKIIASLFVASMPGFYVIFPRYQYFKKLYYNLSVADYLRIGIVSVLFVVITVIVFTKYINNNEAKKINYRNEFFVIFCGLSYMAIPSIPNSVASMYQGIVGFNGSFLTLPVTFMEYFAASFVVCYVIWLIIRYAGKRFFVIIITVLCILVANIQEMNDIFSWEQNRNFNRLVEIESFLKTDVVRNLQPGRYYSEDLYKQQNILAIHDGYWSGYCNNVLGVPIQITKESDGTELGNIFYDDDVFVVTDFQNIVVVAKEEETKQKAIQIDKEKFTIVNFDANDVTLTMENGYYVYSFPNEEKPHSSKGYKPLRGYYSDGWLESDSEFYVSTGEKGDINIELLYPSGKISGKNVEIYLDGELVKKVFLEDELTSCGVNIGANVSGNIRLHCNFEYEEKDNSDIRPLAIMLSKIEIN